MHRDDAAAFLALSPARRAALAREARIYCNRYAHMASAGLFWRGLSATQVRELARSAKLAEAGR